MNELTDIDFGILKKRSKILFLFSGYNTEKTAILVQEAIESSHPFYIMNGIKDLQPLKIVRGNKHPIIITSPDYVKEITRFALPGTVYSIWIRDTQGSRKQQGFNFVITDDSTHTATQPVIEFVHQKIVTFLNEKILSS